MACDAGVTLLGFDGRPETVRGREVWTYRAVFSDGDRAEVPGPAAEGWGLDITYREATPGDPHSPGPDSFPYRLRLVPADPADPRLFDRRRSSAAWVVWTGAAKRDVLRLLDVMAAHIEDAPGKSGAS